MRDLRDFFNPNLVCRINGTEFTVPAPTAEEGLHLHMLINDPDKAAQANDFDIINRLFRGDDTNSDQKLAEGKVPTGGLWDELWDGGVTFPEAMHLGMTAVMYFSVGEDAAVGVWESVGKGITADPMVAEREPEPEKKPQTRSRKKTTS